MEEKSAENKPAGATPDFKGEFVCAADCCAAPRSTMRIGKHWATALAGFVAGSAAAAIMLLPWLFIQGELCDAETDLIPPAAERTAPEAPAPETPPTP